MVPINGGVITGSRHNGVSSNNYGSNSNKGYPNTFADPNAVAANFRLPLFSDSRAGVCSCLRGLKRWNLDFAMAKTTRVTERVSMRFDVQMINVFNHPLLNDANSGGNTGYNGVDLSTDVPDFGVMYTQSNLPRYVQWGLRFDF